MFEEFYNRLNDFDYDELKWSLVEKIKNEINHYTDIRGGKFTYENLEKVHPACGALGDFVINWYEASVYKRKLLDIEEARTAKSDEIARLN